MTETRIEEIAAGVYRLSTFVPDVLPPSGFTFNQFLIAAEEPLLFHCGHRFMFPQISAAIAKVIPIERLRWVTFSHIEADESGAMNLWLAAAPRSEVAHGALACSVSLKDMADRPPRALADGEVMDLGGRRARHLATPHLPHGWEACLLYEETTATLFCSDLFAQVGRGSALGTSDILSPAIRHEENSRAMSLTPTTAQTIRRLAALKPRTIALMHGPVFTGDTVGVLEALADYFETELRTAVESANECRSA